MSMNNSSWIKAPFYMFFIIRPDGNSAYNKMHKEYQLKITADQFLGLISLMSAVNNLQTGIVNQDIVSARKEELDLEHRSSIKSLSTSEFQIRIYDSVSSYRFVLMAGNHIEAKQMDSKLQQIYRAFVNYVIKAPFFNKEQSINSEQFKKITNQILYK